MIACSFEVDAGAGVKTVDGQRFADVEAVRSYAVQLAIGSMDGTVIDRSADLVVVTAHDYDGQMLLTVRCSTEVDLAE